MVAKSCGSRSRSSLRAVVVSLAILILGGVTAYAEFGDLLDSFTPAPSGNGRANSYGAQHGNTGEKRPLILRDIPC